MGWDPIALLMVEICTIEGLFALERDGKHHSADYIEGYVAAMEDRVVEHYWGSESTNELGALLHKHSDSSQLSEFEKRVHAIFEDLVNMFKERESNPDNFGASIKSCRKRLHEALEELKTLNTGSIPLKELELLSQRLDDDRFPNN
jgi:hypothetical protein